MFSNFGSPQVEATQEEVTAAVERIILSIRQSALLYEPTQFYITNKFYDLVFKDFWHYRHQKRTQFLKKRGAR